MLAAAGLVKGYDGVRLLGVEIRRWIVESEMTVFAHADEGDINRRLLQFIANRFHDGGGIVRAAEEMVFTDADFVDEALAQVFAEAGRMRFGQADIFIEVKHFDVAPIDTGCGGKSVKKFELGCPGGGDDASQATRSDGVSDDCCGPSGGGGREGLFVWKFSKDQIAPISRERLTKSKPKVFTVHDIANGVTTGKIKRSRATISGSRCAERGQ